MPANTPNGLPYPLGSDPVADGDDAIKGLAQMLRIAHGSYTVTLPTVGTVVGTAVTFPVGLFTTKPVITATYGAQAVLPNLGTIGIGTLTPTGVTLNALRIAGGSSFSVDVHWHAMRVGTGPGPA